MRNRKRTLETRFRLRRIRLGTFIIILPFLGVFVYLIARGGKMHERAAADAAQQQKAFDTYVKQAAGSAGDNTADQLSKLADLKSQGVITDAEFDAQKAKVLAG